MKVSLLFISILISNVFSITKIYYYDKCDPSYTSFMDARKSVGIIEWTTSHLISIAKLNSAPKEDFMYKSDKYPFNLYMDPEVDDYLLNLLKKGKLISYIDNYLPIEEIRRNFENTHDFYQNKNILVTMCSYFLQNSNMKTPFIAAILGILDYTKNFGKLQYHGENSEFVGKIVTQIPLKDLKELNASNYRIGCLEWKDEDAQKLLELYLEVGKGSNNLSMEQVALAEAKMIVNDLLTNEKRKIQYDRWNDIIEWKNERYHDHPAKYYAQYFLDLSSCRVICPDDKTIDKIYKIITEPPDYSEQKRKIIELKEKVYKMTNDLFGVEITYSDELAVEKINLPYGEISIKILHDIKFEKKGIINYIIENNKIKSIDFSFNDDMIDNFLNKIKEAAKGKFQIILLNDFHKKMEQSINNANIYINYIFPSTLELAVEFSSKLDKNIKQDSVVIYTITFKQNNLYKEVIKNLYETNAYKYIQDGFEKVLEFLKDNFFYEYSLINLLLILIGLGVAGVTGGAVAPIPI